MARIIAGTIVQIGKCVRVVLLWVSEYLNRGGAQASGAYRRTTAFSMSSGRWSHVARFGAQLELCGGDLFNYMA